MNKNRAASVGISWLCVLVSISFLTPAAADDLVDLEGAPCDAVAQHVNPPPCKVTGGVNTSPPQFHEACSMGARSPCYWVWWSLWVTADFLRDPLINWPDSLPILDKAPDFEAVVSTDGGRSSASCTFVQPPGCSGGEPNPHLLQIPPGEERCFQWGARLFVPNPDGVSQDAVDTTLSRSSGEKCIRAPS